jgi:hypothetical protein
MASSAPSSSRSLDTEARLEEIVRVHGSLLSRTHLNYESIIKQETVDEIYVVRRRAPSIKTPSVLTAHITGVASRQLLLGDLPVRCERAQANVPPLRSPTRGLLPPRRLHDPRAARVALSVFGRLPRAGIWEGACREGATGSCR